MMTAEKELIGNIKHYFNLNLNEVDEKRLNFYIGNYKQKAISTLEKPPVIVKKVVERVYVHGKLPEARANSVPAFSLDQLAEFTCNLYVITKEQLRTDSPSNCYHEGKAKLTEYVNAREFFVKMASANLTHTLQELADYLGYSGYSPHTAIIHLQRGRKQNVNATLMNYIQENGYTIPINNKSETNESDI